MNSTPGYRTPAAFRRALTEKLRATARPQGPWALPDLQRQFAYDRLLVRLYQLDDAWILKGATALLARRIAVRHTIDVEFYREASRKQAERDLRTAIARDAGDWFQFEAGESRPVADGANGVRVPIVARIGATAWAQFHVDVVAEGVCMTGRPDHVPALTNVALPGLAHSGYWAYPLVDHIADKTCAILERPGGTGRPSTRFKDLVDLVALVANAKPSAAAQRRALDSEAGRRGISLPGRFEVPDVPLWRAGYAAEAGRALDHVTGTLEEALAEVSPFLDPLLDGSARGTWVPGRRVWAGPPSA
jgi:hypothetical protein